MTKRYFEVQLVKPKVIVVGSVEAIGKAEAERKFLERVSKVEGFASDNNVCLDFDEFDVSVIELGVSDAEEGAE